MRPQWRNEAQKLRKLGVPLLTVLEVVQEIQGHLRDIAEEAHWEYTDEMKDRELTESEIAHLTEGPI